MIKINLLGDMTAVDHTAKFIVAGYAASLVFTGLVCMMVYRFTASEVDVLTKETGALETQLAKLKETTKEVRDLQTKEEELNNKLSIIAKLKRNKIGPVRVMDDLNMALPERAWLSEVKESTGILRITGFALDNQTIATFMKDLEASDYFETVELVESREAERDGVKIKTFTMDTRIDYAGTIVPTTAAAATGKEKS